MGRADWPSPFIFFASDGGRWPMRGGSTRQQPIPLPLLSISPSLSLYAFPTKHTSSQGKRGKGPYLSPTTRGAQIRRDLAPTMVVRWDPVVIAEDPLPFLLLSCSLSLPPPTGTEALEVVPTVDDKAVALLPLPLLSQWKEKPRRRQRPPPLFIYFFFVVEASSPCAWLKTRIWGWQKTILPLLPTPFLFPLQGYDHHFSLSSLVLHEGAGGWLFGCHAGVRARVKAVLVNWFLFWS